MEQIISKRLSELALRGRGRVKTNPLVGSIITTDDQLILSEGYHEMYGGPHAEIVTLNKLSSKHEFQDKSTLNMYVSLEPCNHTGKTGPCSHAVKKSGICRLTYGEKDINPSVSGNGHSYLEANQVATTHSPSPYTNEIIRPFTKNQETQMPYVILKHARTLNNYIGKSNEEVAISNPWTKRLVHKWRSEIDAILIGINTALVDDPLLTTRHYFGSHPTVVILDREARLTEDAALIGCKDHNVILISQRPYSFDLPHVSNHILPGSTFDLENILKILYQSYKIGVLMVEGGGQVLQSFVNEALWDEARVILADFLLDDGIEGPNLPIPKEPKLIIGNDKVYFKFRKHSC